MAVHWRKDKPDTYTAGNEEWVNRVDCNKCGETIYKGYKGARDNVWNENGHIHLDFFYGSPLDGFMVEFDLCPTCIVTMCKSFKIKPLVKDYQNPNAYYDSIVASVEDLEEALGNSDSKCT